MAAGVHSIVFESFRHTPDAWHDICKADDLAMDIRVLDVLQRTLRDQCQCWGVIVFDKSGLAIGCAALCAFPTEWIDSANPIVIRWRDRLRQLMPGLGRTRVLYCGLPLPSGTTHLRLRDETCAGPVVQEVVRVMRRLATFAKCRLLVFKEFDDESVWMAKTLPGLGFIRGGIPPKHLFKGAFANFEEYRQALKSRYRAQVERSRQKLQDAGFEALTGRGDAFFIRHFDDHTHRLYLAVHQRAELKLERMPVEFFREMARALGEEVSLTLIRRDGRIYAFTFAITRGDKHYNLYSGLDYALNNEGDLYFNLFYQDMDQAFRTGAESLHLGQTSNMFKSRLGSKAQSLHFFVHAPSPVLHSLLRLFSTVAFPKIPAVESRHVFANSVPQ